MSGPLRLERAGLASVLPAEAHIFVSGCSAESKLFEDEIEAAGHDQKNITISGVFVPGLNRQVWDGAGSVVTFFQTPELRRRPGQTRFLPFCYQDIARWYEQRPKISPLARALAITDNRGDLSPNIAANGGTDVQDKHDPSHQYPDI